MRPLALAAAALLALAGVMALGPIAQDPHYHAFADTRTVFGISNFFNVVSNVPFLIVGIMGMGLCRRDRHRGASTAWTTFFGAVALVCLGSSYYHLAPTSATLVWDRLPITIAFMALLVGLLSEHVSARLERRLLVPALAVGLASVAWWHYSGDLRFYVWVQFAPLLVLPLALWLFPPRYTQRHYLLYGLAFYAAAKIAEFYDGPIYSWTGDRLSGHSLKHLLACMGAACIYAMLRRRGAGTEPTAPFQHAR